MAATPHASGTHRPATIKLSIWMRTALTILALSSLLIAGLLAVLVMRAQQPNPIEWGVRTHGVLLTNGQAYYGQIVSADERFVVLDDVFYVQTLVDPKTKATKLTLVKRGAELHQPTRMHINASQVQFIEPVGPGSEIARLIAQAK